jgi:hypothetical protein
MMMVIFIFGILNIPAKKGVFKGKRGSSDSIQASSASLTCQIPDGIFSP